MAGIFISKGMTVTIPAGGLKISLGPDRPYINGLRARLATLFPSGHPDRGHDQPAGGP